jgi:uncharacterized membrane protein YeaQ/YmgE (transglycosylase-associated protein family)
MIRAFRPYQSNVVGDGQRVLFARGAYFTCLAIAVTLGADVVAMLRFPSVWIGSMAGYVLVGLVVGMALLTALMGWSVHRLVHDSESRAQAAHRGWMSAIVISLVGAVICALYPQNWRQYVRVGGFGTFFILFTAFLGMVIFFLAVRTWGKVVSPSQQAYGEDFIDDLAALYRGFKVFMGRLSVLLVPVEKLLGSSLLRPVIDWLNPRKNRWYGIALVGILIGAVFAFGETGLHTGITRIELFASIECLGVLLGYALFAKTLWLARDETGGRPAYNAGHDS